MTGRRTYGSYNDGCASAHALDMIGERWALIVVRELLLGPKRFVDIQRDIPGIGPGPLSQRLQELEETGVVERRLLPEPARVTVYGLTKWGHGLEAVNTALSLWAVQSPRLPLEADMGPDTLVLAMRAHARPLAAGSPDRTVALKLTDSRTTGREAVAYLATLTSTGSWIDKTAVIDGADAEVSSTTRAWKNLIIGGAVLDRAEDITSSGDRKAVQALINATKL
ncbi:helix-turn-helix transcriptional regulator [Paeniglutamicibacter antarcticus]|uniref:Helix-turn-helix transcriptional regulator n=1 Tax=Arthrobacter terrae TaxID=2935737 RepID=A0A931CRY6_9MICC|nr:helix-turn-helix domain-containing protein [Arthrobacter terrae]MBG0741495.1 helix-turn-helix transcriptional regulator [Arthrobacter terrae]